VLDSTWTSNQSQAAIFVPSASSIHQSLFTPIIASFDILLHCIGGVAVVFGLGGNSLNLRQNIKIWRQDRYANLTHFTKKAKNQFLKATKSVSLIIPPKTKE
jgi:hypothetical protein